MIFPSPIFDTLWQFMVLPCFTKYLRIHINSLIGFSFIILLFFIYFFAILPIEHRVFDFEYDPIPVFHIRRKFRSPFCFNHFNSFTTITTFKPREKFEKQRIVLFAILCRCVYRTIGTGEKPMFNTAGLYLTFFKINGRFLRIHLATVAFT